MGEEKRARGKRTDKDKKEDHGQSGREVTRRKRKGKKEKGKKEEKGR